MTFSHRHNGSSVSYIISDCSRLRTYDHVAGQRCVYYYYYFFIMSENSMYVVLSEASVRRCQLTWI